MTRANLALWGRFMPRRDMSRMWTRHGGRNSFFIPSPPVGLYLALASSRAMDTLSTAPRRYLLYSSGVISGSSDSILSCRAFCIRRLNFSCGRYTRPEWMSQLISFQSTLLSLLASLR